MTAGIILNISSLLDVALIIAIGIFKIVGYILGAITIGAVVWALSGASWAGGRKDNLAVLALILPVLYEKLIKGAILIVIALVVFVFYCYYLFPSLAAEIILFFS